MNPFNLDYDNLFKDVSPLLTTKDVASYLGVSKPKVRQLVKENRLTPVRIGSIIRYSQAELKRFIESGGSSGS
jgi:excisionase family DNA binding protein